MTEDTLSGDQPVVFGDGNQAELADGVLTFTFDNPITAYDVVLQTSEGVELVAVTINEDGDESETSLLSNPDEATENPINSDDVTTVVIKKIDGSDIEPSDIIMIEVVACKERKTTNCSQVMLQLKYFSSDDNTSSNNTNTNSKCDLTSDHHSCGLYL